MAMDLPITRISMGILTQLESGGVSITDCAWHQELIGLHNNVALGDIVACVHTKRDGMHIRKLMRITSDYEFETLNRRMIKSALKDTLHPQGLLILDIGLLYEQNGHWFVGERPITIQPDGDSGEFHYTLESH